MIFHKALLKPAATDVSAELMDADTQVGIVVSWAGCSAARMFCLEGFSTNRALAWFQEWADAHVDVIAHALAVSEKRRAAAEAGDVTGKYPEPLVLDPADPLDAALDAQLRGEFFVQSEFKPIAGDRSPFDVAFQPEPKLEPASQPDAALAAQREAERLDERLDPALQREANSGH